jgi:protein-S-isoprenylcysteine O-methyltransferase Ste14
MMGGIPVFLYSMASYVLFLLTFLYSIGFVGDFGVGFTVDRGRHGAWPAALIVDLVLLGLFAVQHTGMARRGFKRWLTGWLPEPAERSTYVLLSSLVLILLFWQWRPLPAVIWEVQATWATWLLYALFAAGWLLVLTGTFVINHFDLFGLRQGWLHARGRERPDLEFKENLYYRLVRHPLMLGFVVAFWAIPRMTAGHLLFAVATTGYILVAVRFFEERDLVAMHGDAYREYRRRVPMLCPWPRPRAHDMDMPERKPA